MIACRWYISAAAVLEFMVLVGLSQTDENFDRAAIELGQLCDLATEVAESNPSPGQRLYRVRAEIRGRRTRLELTVSTDERPEGPLSQLVRVRDKDRGRGHR